MYSETRRIRSLIKSCYTGPSWHGPAIMEVLDNMDLTLIGKRINDSHNIIELVHHITSWKLFIIKKLDSDPDFDVLGNINFTKIDKPTEADWNDALERLNGVQAELLDRLKNTEDSVLVEGVPGRSYSFFFLLTGIVNHDLYHLGQIQFLRKFA